MHILLATDADWIVDEVTNALGGQGDTFTVCRDGRIVTDEIEKQVPDLAIFDLQVGSMGGMAVTMSLRLDESADRIPHVPVLMLLDRVADVHLARRSGAEGWLVKPLDSLRLKRAATAIIAGVPYTEGVPVDADPVDAMVPLGDDDTSVAADGESDAESSEAESVDAG